MKQGVCYKVLWLTSLAAHDKAPEYLCELLEQRDVKRTLRSSRQITFIQPRTRTKTFGDRAVAAAAPRLWNALPAALRNITDSDKFNNSLKIHYLEKHMVVSSGC